MEVTNGLGGFGMKDGDLKTGREGKVVNGNGKLHVHPSSNYIKSQKCNKLVKILINYV